MSPATPLLRLEELTVHFPIGTGLFGRERGSVQAVTGLNLEIFSGETFGLVGESGCGKSTAARAAIRLIEPTRGRVIFDGHDLGRLNGDQLRRIRKDFQMVFQDSYASLNPRRSVEDLIQEPLIVHSVGTAREQREWGAELLQLVGLSRFHATRKPGELSGGQRQRVGIARALALHPKLLVADEPVSALDVSVQAQVLNLMQDLQEKLHVTYFFISHNLSVVKHVSQRVGVMYLGRLVETASARELYRNPLHPYTQALLSAVPEPDPEQSRRRLMLKGEVPNPANPPAGCVFHTRCPARMEVCTKAVPPLRTLGTDHEVACHLCHSVTGSPAVGGWLGEPETSQSRQERRLI
jgi:oligopeptide transport system ATP-binding protein